MPKRPLSVARSRCQLADSDGDSASKSRNPVVRLEGEDVLVRRSRTLVLAVALSLTACGSDSPSAAEERRGDIPAPAKAKPAAKAPKGTKIKLGESEFGTMLFGSNGQAIYVFEDDPKGKSVCYGDCARAWPPVVTRGEPRAGKGVRKSLLGTVERRNGKRQLTYGGKPLYFYAHEGPGEVLCHNVNLNGGFWWVVGPDGRRRP
jgi:predicted lipoprotein with Yx(FWY)xxD motif